MKIVALLFIPFCSIGLIVGCANSDSRPAASGAQPLVAPNGKSSASAGPNGAPSAEMVHGAQECSIRLQEIGGLFLDYYVVHQELPKTLDELRANPDAKSIGDFSCPVSSQPYIYDRDGKRSPSGAGQVILYDAAPSHGGLRLCLEIIRPQGANHALLTNVIRLPESFFQAK